MSLDYAVLARTPSGALTAASKRAVDAERAQWQRQAMIDSAHRIAARDELALFEEATNRYDTAFPDNEPQTEREERLVKIATEAARKEGYQECKWEMLNEQDGAVYDWIYRIETLGLDRDLSAVEVLRQIEKELEDLK